MGDIGPDSYPGQVGQSDLNREGADSEPEEKPEKKGMEGREENHEVIKGRDDQTADKAGPSDEPQTPYQAFASGWGKLSPGI